MKKMTQELLVKILSDRGWRVEDLKDIHNKIHSQFSDSTFDHRFGISIRAKSPLGYILSIQASGGHYCVPKAFSSEYDSVEFAIWVDSPSKDRPLIKFDELHDDDEVVGWADYDKVMRAILLLEGDKPVALSRDDPPWDVGD